MDTFAGYSLNDWLYAIVAGVIGSAILAAILFILRWVWHWIRSSSTEWRRTDQATRIIKVYVYRRHIGKKTIYSLARGEFYVIRRCLQMFLAGLVIASMGAILAWAMSMELVFYMMLGLAVWLFVEAVSWLDSRWSEKPLRDIDEQALADAAAILGETVDEIRSQVTAPAP